MGNFMIGNFYPPFLGVIDKIMCGGEQCWPAKLVKPMPLKIKVLNAAGDVLRTPVQIRPQLSYPMMQDTDVNTWHISYTSSDTSTNIVIWANGNDRLFYKFIRTETDDGVVIPRNSYSVPKEEFYTQYDLTGFTMYWQELLGEIITIDHTYNNLVDPIFSDNPTLHVFDTGANVTESQYLSYEDLGDSYRIYSDPAKTGAQYGVLSMEWTPEPTYTGGIYIKNGSLIVPKAELNSTNYKNAGKWTARYKIPEPSGKMFGISSVDTSREIALYSPLCSTSVPDTFQITDDWQTICEGWGTDYDQWSTGPFTNYYVIGQIRKSEIVYPGEAPRYDSRALIYTNGTGDPEIQETIDSGRWDGDAGVTAKFNKHIYPGKYTTDTTKTINMTWSIYHNGPYWDEGPVKLTITEGVPQTGTLCVVEMPDAAYTIVYDYDGSTLRAYPADQGIYRWQGQSGYPSQQYCIWPSTELHPTTEAWKGAGFALYELFPYSTFEEMIDAGYNGWLNVRSSNYGAPSEISMFFNDLWWAGFRETGINVPMGQSGVYQRDDGVWANAVCEAQRVSDTEMQIFISEIDYFNPANVLSTHTVTKNVSDFTNDGIIIEW